MSGPINLSFLDSHRPVLSVGEYSLTLTQTVAVKGVESSTPISKTFRVEGPRYRLLPEDMGPVFPPPDSIGDYEKVLPHVALTRSTLPWERSADSNTTMDGPPWLAILLIYESESSNVETGVVKQSDLDKTRSEGETALVIDADQTFFESRLPSKANLATLCHVRKGKPEVAVVLCGRVPHATEMNTAYLVSVEGCYSGATFAAKFAGQSSKARLVVFKSWRFTPGDPEQSLQAKLGRLTAAPFTSVQQSTVPSPPDASLFSYRMRGGGTAAAFYRGPLATGKVYPPVVDNALTELRSADALIRYREGAGVFDVTYAAAWELGRVLALASATFSQTLIRWKHDAKAAVLASIAQASTPHIDFGRSAGSAAGSRPVPIEISSFIAKLKSFEMVPVNYLLPDQDAVPPESIRYFQVDEYWMRCLFEGAVSIGRNLASDAGHEKEIRSAIESNPVTNLSRLPRYGFLLRSEVVAGYPNLVVEATDNSGAVHLPAVTRLLAPGLKLYAFDVVVNSFGLHPAPEEVHCEASKSLPVVDTKLSLINKTSSAELAAELTAEITVAQVTPGAAAK